MHLFRYNQFYYETPADGGSAPAAVAQPAPGAPVEEAAAPIEGQGDVANDFWNLFPDVPAEHRPLLEPHIKAMQGHVTKLEQQLAPFKPFVDSGLKPEEAQGLIKFSTDFDQAPLDMWLKMGEMLQSQDSPIIDPEVDLEYLALIARGEVPEEEAVVETPAAPVDVDPNNPLAQTVEQLQQTIRQMQEDQQRERMSQQERVQDRLLTQRMDNMRTELTKAGYPEKALTDDALVARILVYKGNVQAAIKSFVDERAEILKGFTQKESDELDLPNGVPNTDAPVVPESNDPWAKGRARAATRLRRENRAAAQ